MTAGEDYRPPITIDGIDIMRIGTADLRSKIGVIPQNPEMFSGTIRSNLDPFGHHTDEDIQSVLVRCGMTDTNLWDRVSEYGQNFSQK